MTTPERLSDEEMDELVKLFRAGHVAAPVPPTPDERIRAGLAVALVASGYRREADVLREAAEEIRGADSFNYGDEDPEDWQAIVAAHLEMRANIRERHPATALEPAQPLPVAASPEVERESIEDALENDRFGICGLVEHFREDHPGQERSEGGKWCDDEYAGDSHGVTHSCGLPNGHAWSHLCRCTGLESYTWPAEASRG